MGSTHRRGVVDPRMLTTTVVPKDFRKVPGLGSHLASALRARLAGGCCAGRFLQSRRRGEKTPPSLGCHLDPECGLADFVRSKQHGKCNTLGVAPCQGGTTLLVRPIATQPQINLVAWVCPHALLLHVATYSALVARPKFGPRVLRRLGQERLRRGVGPLGAHFRQVLRWPREDHRQVDPPKR